MRPGSSNAAGVVAQLLQRTRIPRVGGKHISSESRGPRPGRIPPHLQDEIEERRRQRLRRELIGPWYRRAPAVGAFVGIVALITGLVLGRTFADGGLDASERTGAMLSDLQQAALIWESGGAQTPPVQQGRTELAGGTTEAVAANLTGWRQAYEQLLVPLESTTLDAQADGVRRLTVTALQRYTDAVEALGAAASVEGPAREVLLAEVDRHRARALESAASARALFALLSGETPASEPTPTLPPLPEPEGVATAPGTTEPTAPTGEATADGTEPGAAEPTPLASEPAPAES